MSQKDRIKQYTTRAHTERDSRAARKMKHARKEIVYQQRIREQQEQPSR